MSIWKQLYDRIVEPSVQEAYQAGREHATEVIAAELERRASELRKYAAEDDDENREAYGGWHDVLLIATTLSNTAYSLRGGIPEENLRDA